ncbi:uncharacterized protein LOC100906583 [Galendromus occidentalis]|uniref:Uncharacterized protein LOC100906583 n=1 Tax=Galendromus occidentalis TaxID=34638 RepID=A0AAJ7SEG9_9ACAR|nr:uncharacterized protein LOC100906583 [Galendromus occidentalis]
MVELDGANRRNTNHAVLNKLLSRQDEGNLEAPATIRNESNIASEALGASAASRPEATGLGPRTGSKSLSPSTLRSPGLARIRHDDSENSSSSRSSSSGTRKKQRLPPDGGWGWMVVLASFAINLISDGVSSSLGVFLPDLTLYFKVGRGHAAWVASLFLSMPLLAGPIASWLTDRYGCRRVCIMGSILASLGFVLSYFSNSLALLYVTFSFAGFGLALCYVTSVVIVAYYFEKKRCLATGLSVCGSGVGTFIFAPLTYMLVAEYTWRGTLLIFAGFFLNMVASGALMRDLDIQNESDDEEDNHSAVSSQWNSASHLDDGKRMYHSLLQLPTYLSNESPKLPVQVLTEMSSKEKGHLKSLLELYPNLWHDVLNQNDDPYLTVKSSPLFKTIQEHRVLEDVSTLFRNDWEKKIPKLDETLEMQSQSSATLPGDATTTIPSARKETVLSLDPGAANNGVVRSSLACATVSTKKSSSLRQNRQASIGPLPLLPRDRANSAAYLRNLRLQRGSLTYRGAMLNIKRYRLKASSCPNIYRNSMTTIHDMDSTPFEFFEDLRDVVCDMMDVRLLTNFK